MVCLSIYSSLIYISQKYFIILIKIDPVFGYIISIYFVGFVSILNEILFFFYFRSKKTHCLLCICICVYVYECLSLYVSSSFYRILYLFCFLFAFLCVFNHIISIFLFHLISFTL